MVVSLNFELTELKSFSEPIGFVKPQVSSKIIEFKDVGAGSVFVGICPGQAFPVPVFRSVYDTC